jgi:hypothetical protein
MSLPRWYCLWYVRDMDAAAEKCAAHMSREDEKMERYDKKKEIFLRTRTTEEDLRKQFDGLAFVGEMTMRNTVQTAPKDNYV